MQPTNKLRFVERDCYVKNGEPLTYPFKQRVLQQLWESASEIDIITGRHTSASAEWRDVPLEGDNND